MTLADFPRRGAPSAATTLRPPASLSPAHACRVPHHCHPLRQAHDVQLPGW